MTSRIRPKSKVDARSENAAATFTLPDSLPCSELFFPVLTHKRPKANWRQIMEESDQRMKEIEEYDNRNTPISPPSRFQKTATSYVQQEIFVCLLPALEDTLLKAKMWNAFQYPHCLFNGIDWIVQEIWNNNPRYPTRKYHHKHVFNIPWVRRYLIEHPRPLYPKSWLWPEEYAATVIQKTVRQYYIQREAEVQEMREFWKKLDIEKKYPELQENKFLARDFAQNFSTAAPIPQRTEKKKIEQKEQDSIEEDDD